MGLSPTDKIPVPVEILIFFPSFDLGHKRIDLMNVLKKAAEKGVVHEVANLKKAFILEEKGEQIIKVRE